MLRFAVVLFLLLTGSTSALATAADFPLWLREVKQDALMRGISAATVARALNNLEPLERIVELDRRQTRGRPAPLGSYLKRRLPPEKVARAIRLYRENRGLLQRLEERYGVPGHYLVALWGIESDFGRNQGKTPVIQALATLAYDGRRGEFFREELFKALSILDHGHVSQERMSGSWAGAMGQVQFMPSTFFEFAVDFDGDGHKDIWDDRADALASAANFLRGIGWRNDCGWGEKVVLPPRFNRRLIGFDLRKSLAEWRRLGVRHIDGPGHLKAALLLPDGGAGPAFLAYDNFRVLLRWNRSTSFALTVGHLAQKIYRERNAEKS